MLGQLFALLSEVSQGSAISPLCCCVSSPGLGGGRARSCFVPGLVPVLVRDLGQVSLLELGDFQYVQTGFE